MIVYQLCDNLHCPVIICDACRTQIVGDGNAYWLDQGTEEADFFPRVWHTHKRCGQYDRVLEVALGGLVLFEELDVHLAQLQHNLTHPLRATKATKAKGVSR